MQSHDIRRLRERLRLTQKQLAKKVKVSTHTVWKWESDKGVPSGTNLMAMYTLLSEAPASNKDLNTVAALSGIQGKLAAVHTLADDIERLEDSMLTSLVRELVKDAGHISEQVGSRLEQMLKAS